MIQGQTTPDAGMFTNERFKGLKYNEDESPKDGTLVSLLHHMKKNEIIDSNVSRFERSIFN